MGMDIETRVAVSLAVQRYLRAAERFEQASNEFNEACQVIRTNVPRSSRFIANIMHKNHLVTVSENGDFNVEEVDTI